MRTILLVLVLFSFAFAPAPLPKQPRDPELQSLQGTWEQIRMFNGPNLVTEQPGELSIIISGETASLVRGNAQPTKWALKIDRNARPRTIDLIGIGEFKDITHLGIYRLENDTLIWCYKRDERPTSFETATTPAVFRMELKRRQP